MLCLACPQVQLPAPHGGAELPADAAPNAGGDRGGHPGPADEHRGLLPAGGLRLDLSQGLRPHPGHRLQVRHGLWDHDLLRPFADPAHGLRSDSKGGQLVRLGLVYGLDWIGLSFVDCMVGLVWFEFGLVWVWVGMI